MQGHWEYFDHGAGIGVRGFGPTQAAAFVPCAWEIPRQGSMHAPAVIYASEALVRAMDEKVLADALAAHIPRWTPSPSCSRATS